MTTVPGPWSPVAPCTPQACAAGADPGVGAVVGPVRRLGRYAAAACVVTAGIALIPLVRRCGASHREALVRAWARAVIAAFGVRAILAPATTPTAAPTSTPISLRVRARVEALPPAPVCTGRAVPPSGPAMTMAPAPVPVAVPGSPPGGLPCAGAAAAPVPSPASRAGASAPGVLVVANHVSWLDILLVAAVRPGRMLAKSEVGHWPVFGRIAARGGTLFIERDRLRALPGTVARIATALRSGATVVAFPEGSTWCGRRQGRFRPAVFQAALDARVPVQPIAVRYHLRDGTPTTAAAFVGEDTLVASLRRVASARGLVAEVRLAPEIPAGEYSDRRRLAAAAQAAAAVPGREPAGPGETVRLSGTARCTR